MNNLQFFIDLMNDDKIIDTYMNIAKNDYSALISIPILKKILQNSYNKTIFNIFVEEINLFLYNIQSIIDPDIELEEFIRLSILEYKEDASTIKKLKKDLLVASKNFSTNKISKIFLYSTALTKIKNDIKLYKDSLYENPNKYFTTYFHDDNVIKYHKEKKQKIKELIKKL